jgi:predicted RNA-binding protein with PUA-like domain
LPWISLACFFPRHAITGTTTDGIRTIPDTAPGYESSGSCYTSAPEIQRNSGNMAYWLMKSEPDAYSIDDLERDRREMWDGIRNYQARNMMRDDMCVGDEAIFYHSACKEPAAVGVMRIASQPYPDPTQFDPESKYYDPKSSEEEPRWVLVDVEFVRKFSRAITLRELRGEPELEGMLLLKRGNRLSITPVEEKHWNRLLELE